MRNGESDLEDYLSDEEIERILAEEQADELQHEAEQPATRNKWIPRIIALVLALVLVGNILTFWPQVYSLAAIEFLRTSRELSQNEAVQAYREAVVVVRAGDSKGTGFNIAPEGLIVTNQHVVGDEETSLVSFADGTVVRAQRIAGDAGLDIAILRTVEDGDWPTLAVDLNRTIASGDPFYVIGNPLFFNRIANEGEVLGMALPGSREQPVLALQAPIYKGNSGSPVIDEDGFVVAVVYATMQMTHTGERQKVGLAVPIGDLKALPLFEGEASEATHDSES